MSNWDGSTWHHHKETDSEAQFSYADQDFALDGEEAWLPTDEGVLHWDGRKWQRYREASTSPLASIAAANGEVWIIDWQGTFLHLRDGSWTTSKPTLPGVAWARKPGEGTPELARTSDGILWMVWQGLWRLNGNDWIRAPESVEPEGDVYRIGATGDRLWVWDGYGVRAISTNPEGRALYRAELIYDMYSIDDVATDGRLTWFATNAGLIEFDGLRWRRLLPFNDRVRSIHRIAAAPNGVLWVVGGAPVGSPAHLPAVMGLLSIGVLVICVAVHRRSRHQQLQQHLRVTQAVAQATGEIPFELQTAAEKLKSPWHGWIAWVILGVGSGVGFILLRVVWPKAPIWTFAAIGLVIHLAITVQQSLVKRKPKPYDPIGPGAPSTYDWGKTVRTAAGAAFVLVLLNLGQLPIARSLRGDMLCAIVVGPIAYRALRIRLMNQALRRGDYDRSLRIIRWFHFYNPSGAWTLRLFGHTLLFAGRYREAEDALRRSLSSSQASQTYGFALQRLGDVLTEQGRYDEAMRSYEAALHSFTWMRRPYAGITEMHLRRGNNTQALATVEKVIDFDGLSPRQRKSNGRPQDEYWALKAWALARTGRSSEVPGAIENALKAVNPKCLPDRAAVHYRAGMAMQTLGNMSEANRHFGEAMKLDPRGRFGALAKAAQRETSVGDASVLGTVEV